MAKRSKRGFNPIYTVIICALSLVLVTIVVVLLMGYRYMSENGIKFIGKVSDGQPISGHLNYPGDNDGELDKVNNTITFDNGDKYVGDIVGLLRHGYGIATFANGDRYEGQWDEDEIDGTGTFYYSNGDIYSGEFKNGKQDGYGTVALTGNTLPESEGEESTDGNGGEGAEIAPSANGDVYEGFFKNGMFHGQGTYTFADGTVYTGEYYEGARHGYGEISHLNGESYKGTWANDKKDGEDGEIHYSNGDEYFGPFINNLPDTRKRDEDGKLVLMENGEYLHEVKGMYFFADGRTYTGYFEAGKIVTGENGLVPDYMYTPEESVSPEE